MRALARWVRWAWRGWLVRWAWWALWALRALQMRRVTVCWPERWSQRSSRLCLPDPPGFNPHGMPAGVVGFNSLYRVVGSLGIQLRFPPSHPGAHADSKDHQSWPSAICQTEPRSPLARCARYAPANSSVGLRAANVANVANVTIVTIVTVLAVVAQSAADAPRTREPTAGGAKRVESLAERLASDAAANLAEAAWIGAVSPVLSIPPTLAEEIDERLALEILLHGHRERPRAVWLALRHGYEPGLAGDIRATTRARRDCASNYPWSDEELERACALLVREALLSRLAATARLPAEAVRDFLARAPVPLPSPGIDPELQRRARRFELSGRLAPSSHSDARRFIEEFERRHKVAEVWRVRYERMMLEVAALADAEEGRALVELAMREGLTRAGWPPQPPRTPTGRISQSASPEDPVLVAVRRARASGSECTLLHEALDALRPVSIERVDAIVISADARVRVGRSNATLSPRAIDAWRRELSIGAATAKGDRRRRVGWTSVEEPIGRAPPTRSPVAMSSWMARMGPRRAAACGSGVGLARTRREPPSFRSLWAGFDDTGARRVSISPSAMAGVCVPAEGRPGLTLRFSRCRDPTSASCDRCSFPALGRRGRRDLGARESCLLDAARSEAWSPSSSRAPAPGR